MEIDRRRSKRYRLDLPERFRLLLPSRPDIRSSFHYAQLCDLAQNGMRMLTNIVQSGSLHIYHPDLTASERCQLEVEVKDEGQTFTLTGKAVWYDQNAEEHAFAFREGPSSDGEQHYP